MIVLIPDSRVFSQADFAITTPEAGSAVMGKVEIRGYIKATNFTTYDLDFGQNMATEEGWFPIQSSDQNPSDGFLGLWDTSSITDGDYRLRLTVHYKDGTKAEVIAGNIRVRNYSPIETNTPAAGITPITKPASTMKPTFQVPKLQGDVNGKNDIEIRHSDLILTGAISVGVGLALAGLLGFLFIRRNQ